MFGIFGNINSPLNTLSPGTYTGSYGEGLVLLLNNLVKFAVVLAGLYAFWNLISAGYMFISAGGEPKNISKAWAKIWQSILGLLIVAGSFLLAIIIGWLIYGPQNAFILVNPTIYTP
jgi:hypothetical protein